MAEIIEHDTLPRTAKVVGGILSDIQVLFRQEIALVRAIIEQELRAVRNSLIALGIAAVFGVVSLVLANLCLIQLIQQMFTELPLWGCYAILAALHAVLAYLLTRSAVVKLVSDLCQWTGNCSTHK